MIARIYDHGKEINRIVADKEFADYYCQKHGYTYELEEEPEQPEPEPQYTEIQILAQQVTDLELAILGGKSNV